MATSLTTLSAEVQNAYNKDKPVLLGENTIDGILPPSDGAPLTAHWISFGGAGGIFSEYTIAGSYLDAHDPAYPRTRAWDRFTHLKTRAKLPGSVTSTSRWAFVFYVPPSGIQATFDSVAIINHNFGSLSKVFGTYNGGSPFQIRLGYSDDGVSWTEIMQWDDPLTNKPLTSFNLYNGGGTPTAFAQFSKASYLQISIVCVGSSMGTTSAYLPEFGELVLGRRLQLLHGPAVPYRERQFGSDLVGAYSARGQDINFVRSAGRRTVEASYTLIDRTNFLNFYQNDIAQGVKQFLYVPLPSRAKFPSAYAGSELGEAYWMALEGTGIALARNDGPFDSTLELSMRESATYNVDMV